MKVICPSCHETREVKWKPKKGTVCLSCRKKSRQINPVGERTKYTRICKCGDVAIVGYKPDEIKRLRKVWSSMKERCGIGSNIETVYTRRGITVCDEWKYSFDEFKKWSMANGYEVLLKDGKNQVSIDRINNNRNYSPENCRWTDKTTQTINSSMNKNNKSGYTGVFFRKTRNNWLASIFIKGTRVGLGHHKTAREGAIVRDNYIISNRLSYPLSIPNSERILYEIKN